MQIAAPCRVRVSNGDKSMVTGEGTYVGDVTVYFIVMPDGSLLSTPNAERKPTDDEIPEGGQLIEADGNPKIEMDSGEVVYGCQVWWEPI